MILRKFLEHVCPFPPKNHCKQDCTKDASEQTFAICLFKGKFATKDNKENKNLNFPHVLSSHKIGLCIVWNGNGIILILPLMKGKSIGPIVVYHLGKCELGEHNELQCLFQFY